jgi:hypothetical protein
MKKTLTLALLFLNTLLCCAQQQNKFNPPLADSLSKWVEIDQIAAGSAVPQGNFKYMNQQQWDRFKDSVFTTHRKILEKILEKNGYPGYDQVGQKGADNFWVMVQHSDKDPDFQQKVLTAMKAEVDKGNASAKDYGYLIDRVKLNTGKKQVYGTQVTYTANTCQAIPRPLEDSLTVNDRRKQFGMEPIEVYLNFMSQMHFDMNKAYYESKGIQKPVLLKIPE